MRALFRPSLRVPIFGASSLPRAPQGPHGTRREAPGPFDPAELGRPRKGTTMLPPHRGPFVAALVTAATLTVTGCGAAVAGGSAPPTAAPSAPATATSAPEAS